jgi:hypothetical protein
MKLRRNFTLSLAVLLAVLAAAPALALKTADVELGLDGVYDDQVHVRRSSAGALTFQDTQVTSAVSLLSLTQLTGAHGSLTGLSGDDHSQYLNTARHGAAHTADFNSSLSLPADADGNTLLGQHVTDADIHLNRNQVVEVPANWRFTGTPQIWKDLSFSALGAAGNATLTFEAGASDAQFAWNQSAGQFTLNKNLAVGIDDSTNDVFTLGGGAVTWDETSNTFSFNSNLYLQSGKTFLGDLEAKGNFAFGKGAAYGAMSGYSYSDTNWQGVFSLYRRSRGTQSTATAVQSGDTVGSFDFTGYDGAAFRRNAQMLVDVDGAVSSGTVPGKITFNVTSTSGVLQNVLIMRSSGNVGVGTTAPAYKLDVAGTLRATGDLTVGADDTTNDTFQLGDAKVIWNEAADTLILDPNVGAAGVVRLGYEEGDKVGIGTSSPIATLELAGNTTQSILLRTAMSIASLAGRLQAVRTRGTLASPLPTEGEDDLFDIEAWGATTQKGSLAACMRFVADGSPNVELPGRIEFHTASASTGAGERMRITSGGFVGIDTNAPDAFLEVESPSGCGQQTMTIDQNDATQGFIDFQGTSGSGYTIGTTEKSTFYRMIMIEANGVKCWLKAYAD